MDGTTLRRRAEEATLRRDALETIRRDPGEGAGLFPETHADGGMRLPEAFSGVVAGERRLLTVEKLLASGGEGDLYLCRSGAGRYVVKVLRHEADPDVLRALREGRDLAEDSHLVPLEYVGSMREMAGQVADDRLYTVSPYYAAGDLSMSVNLRRINPSLPDPRGGAPEFADPVRLDEDEFTRLVRELHAAVRTLHTWPAGGSIVHRDIRPENIMVDADGAYRLGDYGLASGLEPGLAMKFTRRFGLSHGYSPPEAYVHAQLRQQVTRKYDYFSLGMTLLHAALGRPRYLLSPPDRPPEKGETSLGEFYETIALSGVQVPQALPERIRGLLRGLLLASPEHRWGDAEVAAWLAGGNPAIHAPAVERSSGISVKVNGSICRGEQEVVHAILRNWALFRGLAADGTLEFRWEDPDLAYRRRVEAALGAARHLDPESGLEEIVQALDPGCGHVFHGLQFASDDDLGRAILNAAPDALGPFADYLARGALRRRRQSAQTDEAAEAVLSMLEAYARVEPEEAVRHLGRLLAGEALLPLSIPLSGGEVLSTDLTGLTREVRAQVEQMLEDFVLRTSSGRPELLPVPGLYGSGASPWVVQADGSVLADPAPLSAVLSVPDRLADILRWMSGGREVHSVSSLAPSLFLHMYTAGWIRSDILPEKTTDGRSLRTLAQIAELLSIFPDFRTGHVLDDAFIAYLTQACRILDGTAGLRLPRAGAPARGSRLDAARQAAKEAVQAYADTRTWEALLHALGVVQEALTAAAGLGPATHAAAVRVAHTFSLVFSGTDAELQQAFDSLMEEYRGAADDLGRLARLISELDRLGEKAEAAARQDLQRYALTDELECLRRLSRERPEAADFVVPDTTDAEVYYTELRRWAQGKRRKRR